MSNLLKIALIEDDVEIKDMYKMKLELGGYSVITAENGSDAVKLIKKEKPNLILLDILLPQKDGFEILAELKKSKDDDISSIPVIMISNLSSKDDQNEAKKLGAIDYLVKAKANPGLILEKVSATLKKNLH
jgi:DNA-binding response OmpR family regulator